MDRERFGLRLAVTSSSASDASDWHTSLPELSGSKVGLRELRLSDASTLRQMLTTDEVPQFISEPPTTVEGFERFVAWTHRERAAGRFFCFGVVPHGFDVAVGIFQVRAVDSDFRVAEWGFAIGSAFWGTGVFMDAARLTIDFAFETIGVTRMEARAAVLNGRGNGALAKVGAVREATLRRSFCRRGEYFDQVLWSILRQDWRQSKAVWGAAVVH